MGKSKELAELGQVVSQNGGNVGIGTSSPTILSGYTATTHDGVSGSFSEYRQNGDKPFRIGSDGNLGGFLIQTDANPMRFYTSAIERMRIDASGRVTKPYQPMAHVWDAVLGDSFTIVFRSASLNQGGHYNTSTGLFTCPVSGVYRVSWHFMKENYQTVPFGMEGRLMVNGGVLNYARSYSYTSTADYGNNGTSILYYANQNDTLGVYVGGTGGVYNDGYSHASFELVG